MDANVVRMVDKEAPVATKDRILDAAESLFMEHGFEATSLRSITAAADVNLAAVNYHFGSKEELFQAVLTRRLDPMNRERLDLLTALEHAAAPNPVACEQILSAMFVPALKLARDRERGGKDFLRLLGRAYADPAPFIRHFLSEQYAVMIARFKAAFALALPELPPKELSWRLHFIMGALSYTLAGTDALEADRRAHARGIRQRRDAAAPSRAVPARGAAIADAGELRCRPRARRRIEAAPLQRPRSAMILPPRSLRC